MNITMTPSGRSTGNTHTIVDEKFKEGALRILPDGTIRIAMKVGPIQTSGDFNGLLFLSQTELYSIIASIEERKLKMLFDLQKEVKDVAAQIPEAEDE